MVKTGIFQGYKIGKFRTPNLLPVFIAYSQELEKQPGLNGRPRVFKLPFFISGVEFFKSKLQS